MLQHDHDVLALAFRPDGKLLATATLDAQIHFWNPMEAELVVRIHKCCFIPLGIQRHSDSASALHD